MERVLFYKEAETLLRLFIVTGMFWSVDSDRQYYVPASCHIG